MCSSDLSSGGVVFEMNNIDNPLPYTNVLFYGPSSSGIYGVPASSSGVPRSYAQWYSGISILPSSIAGQWNIAYGTNNYSFLVPDLDFPHNFVAITPTVLVSNDCLQSISWTYNNPTNGIAFSSPPSAIESLHIGINNCKAFYKDGISTTPTNYTFTNTLLWSQTTNISIGYSSQWGF